MMRPTGPCLSLCPCMDGAFAQVPLSWLELAAHWGRWTAEAGLLGRPGAWDVFIRSREDRRKVTQPGVLAFTQPSVPLQCDRLAADCAQELRRHGVSYVSLWPGLVQTETLKEYMIKADTADDHMIEQVGEGRARAAEKASPSSKTRQ